MELEDDADERGRRIIVSRFENFAYFTRHLHTIVVRVKAHRLALLLRDGLALPRPEETPLEAVLHQVLPVHARSPCRRAGLRGLQPTGMSSPALEDGMMQRGKATLLTLAVVHLPLIEGIVDRPLPCADRHSSLSVPTQDHLYDT